MHLLNRTYKYLGKTSQRMKRYYARADHESRAKAYESDSIVKVRAEAYRKLTANPLTTSVFIMDAYSWGGRYGEGHQIGFAQRYRGGIMMYIRPKLYGSPAIKRQLRKDGTLGKAIE